MRFVRQRGSSARKRLLSSSQVGLLVIVLLVVACGRSAREQNSGIGQSSETIVFPVQNPTEFGMLARLRGTLLELRGCLYVSPGDAKDMVLPIWPHGYTYTADPEGVIRVVDDRGRVVGEVGSSLTMGGGMFGEQDTPLPAQLETRVQPCHGPYWLVGEIDPL